MSRQDNYVAELLHASPVVRKLVWTALGVVLVLLVATCVSLLLQIDRNEATTRKALAALQKAQQVEVRLEAEAVGECFRVDYLRWQDDRWRYASWQRDKAAAFFLAHGISPAIKRLSRVFDYARRQDRFLPYTNCQNATRSPLGYTPPRAIPFERIPQRVIIPELDRPDFGLPRLARFAVVR